MMYADFSDDIHITFRVFLSGSFERNGYTCKNVGENRILGIAMTAILFERTYGDSFELKSKQTRMHGGLYVFRFLRAAY